MVKQLFHTHAKTEGVSHRPDTIRSRSAQFCGNCIEIGVFFIQPVDADFQSAQGFLKRFLEGAAYRHHFAHRFHLGSQAVVGLGKFFKSETRNLGHHIIDGGLERSRSRATGNFVFQFVQRVTDCQLGRDFSNRETGRLGGQSGRARHTRIHFDHHHAPVNRVGGKLHVGAAGIHADFAQHRDARVAHDLVFLVGQRLRRSYGDRITGMHAHRVKVFY